MSLLFATINLVLCAFFFIFCFSYLRRRTGPERILAEFREEVDKLIAEINSATDRDATLVEERIKTVRGLLDDADRRISVYVRELDRRRAQEKAYADLGKAPIRYTEPAPVVSESAGLPANRADSPDTEKPVAAPQEERHLPQIVHRRSLSLGIEVKPLPLPERVADLYRTGITAPQIAEKLGVTLAEVDLAIALLERKGR